MKKRTKLELVIFALVAVIYFIGLWRDRPQEQPAQAALQQETSGSFIQLPVETDARQESSGGHIQLPQETGPAGTQAEAPPSTEASQEAAGESEVEEDGVYTDAEHVALYIHTYGHLPSNYITKREAEAAGWDSEKGNLGKVLPGYSIGGDRFGNYEKLLPRKKGRTYYECDIGYNPKKGSRGAKRIVYSNDGLIYYTDDHYNSFELLYGEE